MATPLTASQALAAFRAEGLRIVELPSWPTRNRAGHGAWGGVNGVMIHHTGSDIDPRAAQVYADGLLQEGYSTLPGPLCHSGISPDGTVFMVGWGRTNHAGGGDPAVLQAVIDEAIPTRKPQVGNLRGTDGNAHFYGVEVMYSGSHPMAAAQRAAAVRWAAALCRAHGWSARSVIGHGEWSNDKWDPGSESMDAFRRDVQALLDKPAGASSTPSSPPTSAAPAAPKPTPPSIPQGAPHMFRVIVITDGKGGYAQGLLNGATGKVAGIPTAAAGKAVYRLLQAMEGKDAGSPASAISFAELDAAKPIFEATSATVFTKESK